MRSVAHDDPHSVFHHCKPDFLVISPPKTGSSWLAANLRRHPQLFIPEAKELKYFSSFFKWLDWSWYCQQFEPAGDRRAGEASPSYASLPLDRIRQIRSLLPEVKLIFLMREPVARAWSHARHNHRYREARFGSAELSRDPRAITHDEWRASFTHDWPLVSGDYLGQLRRWSSVFPREQLYVGFYETIRTQPDDLLREVFQFLGVDSTVDLTSFPLRERILEGSPLELPPELGATLRCLLRKRTEELAAFLREGFNRELPIEWHKMLAEDVDEEICSPQAFSRETDDAYLTQVVAQEEGFVSDVRMIEEYRGYNIVFYRGQLLAFARSLGPLVIPSLDAATVKEFQNAGTCLTGTRLDTLRERITGHLLEATERRLLEVEGQLQSARERLQSAREEHRLARDEMIRVSEEARHATTQLRRDIASIVAHLHRPSRLRRLIRAARGLQPERAELGSFLRHILASCFSSTRQKVSG
jgi:hypothetical protein